MAKKTSGTQTSTKAGVRSLAKKMDTSRHGFGTQPASRKVAGASGQEGTRKSTAKAGTASKRGKGDAIAKMKSQR